MRFECVQPVLNISKFWEFAIVAECEVRYSWGRRGTAGQTTTTTYMSARAMQSDLEGRVTEKLSKGYRPVKEDGSLVTDLDEFARVVQGGLAREIEAGVERQRFKDMRAAQARGRSAFEVGEMKRRNERNIIVPVSRPTLTLDEFEKLVTAEAPFRQVDPVAWDREMRAEQERINAAARNRRPRTVTGIDWSAEPPSFTVAPASELMGMGRVKAATCSHASLLKNIGGTGYRCAICKTNMADVEAQATATVEVLVIKAKRKIVLED